MSRYGDATGCAGAGTPPNNKRNVLAIRASDASAEAELLRAFGVSGRKMLWQASREIGRRVLLRVVVLILTEGLASSLVKGTVVGRCIEQAICERDANL